MIASLGMYDMPHAQAATDRFWQAIHVQLDDSPAHLRRGEDLWQHWHAPDLYLSQTCGLPYRARLCDQVTLVGTPDYGLRQCPAGYYFSYMIRRKGDQRSLTHLARRGVMAFNDPLSQSGWAAPIAHLNGLGLRPSDTWHSGSHIASAKAVIEGGADYAAIDVVTYQMWSLANPQAAAQLETFERTDPTPGLPLITAQTRDPRPLTRAVSQAIRTLSDADRDILLLRGLVQIPQHVYRTLPIPALP